MESLHKRQLWTIQPNNLYRYRLVVGTDSAEGSVRAADQRGNAKVAKGASARIEAVDVRCINCAENGRSIDLPGVTQNDRGRKNASYDKGDAPSHDRRR